MSSSPETLRRCELRVGDMDCPSCADGIRRAVGEIEGSGEVHVDVVRGTVRAEYDPDRASPVELADAIRSAGYSVEDGIRRTRFRVAEMDCGEEVRQIEDAVRPLPGVSDLRFDLLSRRLIVEGDVSPAEVLRAIETLGMTCRREGDPAASQTFWQRRGRLIMTVISGTLLLLAFALRGLGVRDLYPVTLLAMAAVAGGWFLVPRAWHSLLQRHLDMNVLMTLAAVGAALIGEWGEAASVVFLFSLAQLIESHSMDRARNAIETLMELKPTEATMRRDGQEQTVPVEQVGIGETFLVRSGQRIPLDGTILSGSSAVNQSPITGESLPVDKGPGEEVFAGSINEQGHLEVRVTKRVQDTTLARIIHEVEEAQASRAPTQSLVDRFARVYTPLVVAAAVIVFLAPPLAGAGAWGTWFYRALALLVVACPCALVISTPVSLVSGLTGAARRGILIKGGLHLENIGRIDTIAFDKTGTLTEGRPAVRDVVAVAFEDEASVLRLAASLEQGSTHPIAKAILAEADRRGIERCAASEFRELAGQGVEASVAGRRLALGGETLCRQRRAGEQISTIFGSLKADGKTVVMLLEGNQPLGVIAVADRLRPEAVDAISRLRRGGIARLVMLTGDNQPTARAIAEALGLDDVHAELLPQDKVDVIRELEARGERVAFVGDGINDAPALAASTVGIAMGAAGTDAAIESADMALMTDLLTRLAEGVRLSQKTLRIIKQNIAFSIAIKVVFVVLAVTGYATLWMAVGADMGASLLVIGNGLRAIRG